ncbi:MAG TPA: D-alanine--D-alanine ligase family protein [Gaiellaceae bacterium]|nr:D-alanine--D-alanine ligase family protein [Gaiellaceae bacterium]
MTQRRLKIAVVTGGRSSEHEIALASARSVRDALDPARYEVVTVEIARDGTWALEAGTRSLPRATEPSAGETLPVRAASDGVMATMDEVDVVLPLLHGPFGEDGTVQGLLELAGVPYVGAGVLSSALAMDKDRFKVMMRGAGVPVTRSVTVHAGEPVKHPYDYPVFVKPARLGSSVGISKVRSAEELHPAAELAFRHDEKILIEEFVDGIEVEVGVLGNRTPPPQASLPGEIVAHGFTDADWYDWSAKYDEGGMDLIVPPRIPEDVSRRVQDVAVAAFLAAECEGMARVDCFVTAGGDVLINELNTIPGFTSTSVYAKLFEASGIPYPDLLDRLIKLAIERHDRRARLEF